jgi:hypothetical protein
MPNELPGFLELLIPELQMMEGDGYRPTNGHPTKVDRLVPAILDPSECGAPLDFVNGELASSSFLPS